jgi:predicted ATPase/DNA-binding SARP family transcriptional activator
MLEVRLLGAFSIKSGDKSIALPSRPAQSLFAFLVLNAGSSHRRERLAGQLWPDSREEAARDYLRHALWRIRKALTAASAAHLLKADDLTITFISTDESRVDAARVGRAAESQTADELMGALAAYEGELLPGFYEEWVVLEREHLKSIYEQEMGRLLAMLEQAGRWSEVLEWAERWIAFGQKPEPAYRGLMMAHAANGDMSKVAVSYERCARTLAEFGVEPSELTRALFEEIKAGKHAAAAKPAAARRGEAAAPSNIPVPLTSFVGRERELRKISELLQSSRLLTLTGPGGVGKTRLAIRAASDSFKKYRDGVCWVGLVGLTDPGLVAQEVAQALHIREAPPEPLLETLIRHLKSRHMLLVLDNCEHLIEACARLSEQLLAACPELRILSTGIEGLGLFNETVWQVPSLPLPESGVKVALKDLRSTESVRLFEDRAANASPAFLVDENSAADVTQICRRLDGIPLAIELAAARMKVLSVQEIAARLDDRFSLLTSGSRTAIPRHQTLRATIDWSHDLLTEPERVLFRRLSVFAGRFTLEAAEVVCRDESTAGAMIEALARLVDRSLVVVDSALPQGATRYRMLETIRQYALEKLVAAEEGPGVRDRHLDFYTRLAEASESSIFVHESGGWSARLDEELDDIRAAVEWGTASGKADQALRILGSLVYFWFARGLLISEWSDRVQIALRRPEGQRRTLARAKALNGTWLWYWGGEVALEDRRAEMEEALSIGRELGDPWNVATALRGLGFLENIRGNYAEAQSLLDESLKMWRGMGSEQSMGTAMTLTVLGDLALNLEQDDRAHDLYEETLALVGLPGDVNWQAYANRRLAHLAWRAGDLDRAYTLCLESFRQNQSVGDPRGVCACLAGFAAIALARRKYEAAATLIGAAEAQLAVVKVRLLYVDRMEYDRTLGRLSEALSQKSLEKLRGQGSGMSVDEALALAEQAAAKAAAPKTARRRRSPVRA